MVAHGSGHLFRCLPLLGYRAPRIVLLGRAYSSCEQAIQQHERSFQRVHEGGIGLLQAEVGFMSFLGRHVAG